MNPMNPGDFQYYDPKYTASFRLGNLYYGPGEYWLELNIDDPFTACGGWTEARKVVEIVAEGLHRG